VIAALTRFGRRRGKWHDHLQALAELAAEHGLKLVRGNGVLVRGPKTSILEEIRGPGSHTKNKKEK
jgi:DNA-binding GntR family transcriptional regulator